VRKITQGGNVTTIIGSGQTGDINGFNLNTSFNHISGISIDASDNLILVDKYNSQIRYANLLAIEGMSDGICNEPRPDRFNYSDITSAPRNTTYVPHSSDGASQIGPTLDLTYTAKYRS
jgi:hypothetical protein